MLALGLPRREHSSLLRVVRLLKGEHRRGGHGVAGGMLGGEWWISDTIVRQVSVEQHASHFSHIPVRRGRVVKDIETAIDDLVCFNVIRTFEQAVIQLPSGERESTLVGVGRVREDVVCFLDASEHWRECSWGCARRRESGLNRLELGAF